MEALGLVKALHWLGAFGGLRGPLTLCEGIVGTIALVEVPHWLGDYGIPLILVEVLHWLGVFGDPSGAFARLLGPVGCTYDSLGLE